jgi:hypothetical protein
MTSSKQFSLLQSKKKKKTDFGSHPSFFGTEMDGFFPRDKAAP